MKFKERNESVRGEASERDRYEIFISLIHIRLINIFIDIYTDIYFILGCLSTMWLQTLGAGDSSKLLNHTMLGCYE